MDWVCVLFPFLQIFRMDMKIADAGGGDAHRTT